MARVYRLSIKFKSVYQYKKGWQPLVYNILNMQRYATSVAGQTCSYSGKAAKGSSQYLWLSENVSLVRHSCAILSYWYGITGLTDKSRWENLLWKCVDYNRILWHEKSTKKPQQTCQVKKKAFKARIALKTFGSAMIYFDFERTVENRYQRSQCWDKGKPRDFERPH